MQPAQLFAELRLRGSRLSFATAAERPSSPPTAAAERPSSPPTCAPRTAPIRMEYHDTDFEYSELRQQLEEYASLVAAQASSATRDTSPRVEEQGLAWDSFYGTHATRFFHPRYFLLRAFPGVFEAADRVLEAGVGNGSNLAVLLEKTAARTVVGVDLSAVAVDALAAKQADSGLGGSLRDAGRVTLAQCDITDAPSLALHARGMDVVLCTFTLSAIPPALHGQALASLHGALREGGTLVLRDYGVGDVAQLRAVRGNSTRIFTPSLHARPDGTLASYFDLTETRRLLEGAGFTVSELRYCCVKNVNRAKGVTMRRVFIHAKARKGGSTGEA